jgi:polyphosphate kinase
MDDPKEAGTGAAGSEPSAPEAPAIPGGPAKQERSPKQKRRARTPRRREERASSPGLDRSLYVNRELSWLEFNQRVLDEARDTRHPLLERVKFLSIVSSNMDEFFMIRVAGIKEQILADVADPSPDGLPPARQIQKIHQRVSTMLTDMSRSFWDDLHPKLTSAGIHLLGMDQITAEERQKLSAYFAQQIFPVLTPLAFDPGHPFPYISNLSLNLAVVVSNEKGEERFARVKVPDVLPRLVEIPNGSTDASTARFVWLEDLIARNLTLLFPGMSVRESYVFRVTRNADIEIQEDEADDLIRSIEESIRMRRYGSVVRVGVESSMPDRIRDILIENLEVTADDVYQLTPPLGLSHLMSLLRLPRPDLKDEPYHPAALQTDEENEDLFSIIRRGDVVLHHPYDSFAPVVQFITSAARDPNVLAIKQTLYRLGKESPLIPLFIEAAENGKQVAVLVELKARFDEENNIIWAKQLERAGIHVVYGLVGLKTHGKMALVVRKEADGLRRYVHLGTGNYNPVTARIYTDHSFFTCRTDIADDVTEVFNFLTGYSRRSTFRKLAVAPISLREQITALIDREVAHARAGREAHLIFKMNALTDTQIIERLYDASCAGVRIDLIVRGACCLRPGVKGISDHVRVISIVGRYLEHSRVYYARNNGAHEVYLSSADLMGRNLDRRVELMFPIEEPALSQQIKTEVLDAALKPDLQARILHPDGTYTPLAGANGAEVRDLQQLIMRSRIQGAKQGRHTPRDSH